jgi:hypothetical protein
MRHCLILLICPFMTGCLVYCYPSLTQTPPITVTETEVSTFRVIENGSMGSFLGIVIALPIGDWQVQELAQGPAEIPTFRDFHFFRGTFGLPLSGCDIHAHSVRLYRRGYETVTIEARSWISQLPGTAVNSVVWKKAETLEARERAIRAIYQPQSLLLEIGQFQNEFVAEEYLALADSPLAAGPENVEARGHLLQYAEVFKEKKPPSDLPNP